MNLSTRAVLLALSWLLAPPWPPLVALGGSSSSLLLAVEGVLGIGGSGHCFTCALPQSNQWWATFVHVFFQGGDGSLQLEGRQRGMSSPLRCLPLHRRPPMLTSGGSSSATMSPIAQSLIRLSCYCCCLRGVLGIMGFRAVSLLLMAKSSLSVLDVPQKR